MESAAKLRKASILDEQTFFADNTDAAFDQQDMRHDAENSHQPTRQRERAVKRCRHPVEPDGSCPYSVRFRRTSGPGDTVSPPTVNSRMSPTSSTASRTKPTKFSLTCFAYSTTSVPNREADRHFTPTGAAPSRLLDMVRRYEEVELGNVDPYHPRLVELGINRSE
nr:hypothetical protein [Rhodococcus opacus]